MNSEFKEITWPPTGFIYDQEFMLPTFCKPKLHPLKSITLEKLEKMQQEAKQVKQNKDQTATEDAIPTEQAKIDIWKADED